MPKSKKRSIFFWSAVWKHQKFFDSLLCYTTLLLWIVFECKYNCLFLTFHHWPYMFNQIGYLANTWSKFVQSGYSYSNFRRNLRIDYPQLEIFEKFFFLTLISKIIEVVKCVLEMIYDVKNQNFKMMVINASHCGWF